MKKYMPLEGLRWSRDSGSILCDTPQNGRSRTGWGGLQQILDKNENCALFARKSRISSSDVLYPIRRWA